VTPIGVLLLIGLGIIVIEHFLPSPAQEAATSTLPNTQITQSQSPRRTTGTAAVSSVAAAPGETGQSTPNSLAEPVQTDPPRAAVVAPDSYLAGLDAKAVELRIKRTELLLAYTEQHPDVVLVDRQLDQLRIERRKYLRQKQRK